MHQTIQYTSHSYIYFKSQILMTNSREYISMGEKQIKIVE